MNALRGFAVLLLCQTAGELLARGLALPWPGPVIGMLVLALLLPLPALHAPVQAAAEVLLAHLSLLFVPIGVGVVSHVAVLREHALALVVAVIGSTWIGLAVTALVLRALWRETPPPASAAPAAAAGRESR